MASSLSGQKRSQPEVEAEVDHSCCCAVCFEVLLDPVTLPKQALCPNRKVSKRQGPQVATGVARNRRGMPPTERPVSEAAALRPTDAITSGGEVDTGAFEGLRGVLALWVVLGHFSEDSFWGAKLAVKSAMPLFFMLSGYANPGMRWVSIRMLHRQTPGHRPVGGGSAATNTLHHRLPSKIPSPRGSWSQGT